MAKELSAQEFVSFSGAVQQKLYFIGDQFAKIDPAISTDASWKKSEAHFDEKCLIAIANYNRCLSLVGTLEDQVKTYKSSIVDICFEVVKYCLTSISYFKKNSLPWISHFLFCTHQLLRLAKDCYSDDNPKQLSKMDELFSDHAKFTTELQKHFVGGQASNSKKCGKFIGHENARCENI